MKYFIQYPIYLDCNLSCPYCFHKDARKVNSWDSDEEAAAKQHGGAYGFTVDDYIKWRDTHLLDAEEIVVHFHGGEPTAPRNISAILEFLDKSKLEKVDILTNGVGPDSSIDNIISFKNRIFRVGLTYHRKVIDHNKELKNRFTSTVLKLKSAGVPLYIKEMLFKDVKSEIIAHRNFWNSMGVAFKIQDFKGYVQGEDFTELMQYTMDDILLLDPEYIKTGNVCTCLPGYRQVMIRGGWNAGDILGCWIDPVVVGNIKDNTYNPNYVVRLSNELNGKMFVDGVPKIYRGTYKGDRYYDNLKENGSLDYTNTN